MRVLIIDDEQNIRQTTAVVLEAMGHETAGADSRASALRQIEIEDFDITFLDLKLGGDNGLDLLPELLKAKKKK